MALASDLPGINIMGCGKLHAFGTVHVGDIISHGKLHVLSTVHAHNNNNNKIDLYSAPINRLCLC